MSCPNCKSRKVRSIDNQPLYHPPKEDSEKNGYGIDSELYVTCKCDECNTEFEKIFTLVDSDTPQKIINNIDWDNLSEQKDILIRIVRILGSDDASEVEGLLSLLDAIQDYAVDELGVAEHVVFPNRRFQITWLANDYEPKTEVVNMKHFTTDNGYEEHMIEEVGNMDVAEHRVFNTSVIIFRLD